MVSINSDEAYARRLQEEEMRAAGFQIRAAEHNDAHTPISAADLRPSMEGGAHSDRPERHRRSSSSDRAPIMDPRMHRPLLERAISNRAAAGPHRDVHMHAIDEGNQITATSPSIVTAVDPVQRDEIIDPQDPPTSIRIHAWVQFIAFCIMMVIQYMFFTTESCADSNPWIYKYSLALIIIFYLSLFLPLVLLVGICLCLPFALLWMHWFSPKPGAKPDLIAKLPMSIYQPPAASASAAAGGGGGGEGAAGPADPAPSCSICMADYEAGEEIRDLPQCSHRFHRECVDRWLAINYTCPLCRAPIPGAVAGHDADDQV